MFILRHYAIVVVSPASFAMPAPTTGSKIGQPVIFGALLVSIMFAE
jgi:hypothetical protein